MADPAIVVIGLMAAGLRRAFTEDQTTPPMGGGAQTVRFLAGDALPGAVWNAHRTGCDCEKPMIYLRVVRRFRTSQLPEERRDQKSGCDEPRALTVEAGIMRCAITDAEPEWDDLEQEAFVALDDSFRLDQALVWAMADIEEKVALSTMLAAGEPYGPEGGIIAWTQWAHIQLRQK
ncbi:hypothetical protein ACPESR_25225 [Nocardia testacea]|uniref:hypothetical protein n=1 Tax=Nocardia testacea TaxID=248551 RepID=UPI003C305F7A